MSSNQSRFGLLGGQMAESKKVNRLVTKNFNNTAIGQVVKNNKNKSSPKRPVNAPTPTKPTDPVPLRIRGRKGFNLNY